MPNIMGRVAGKPANILFAFAPAIALLAACKPPPTDADMLRDMPEAAPTFASDPLPSPDTEGAVWALSTRSDKRIIYGVPGDPALLALACIESPEPGAPQVEISRFASADEGAGALLALVGNGHIGRIAVDASEMGEDMFWQGSLDASDDAWAPLLGPRELTSTVPGAGMVTLNPSALPGLFIKACQDGTSIEEAAVAEDAPPEEEADEEASPLPR